MTDDEEARRAIRTRLDATLFVEAGAGTGKTTELVHRVVALVRVGAAMARIAAITFTEKAASELRDRLRVELERGAVEGDERCATAVADLDEAPIQTLHAFAQRILAAHPLAVGLPPGFEVVGETESSVAFAERWAEALDRLLADPDLEPVVGPAFAVGLTPAHLRSVAWELHRNWDRLAVLDGPIGPDTLVRAPVDAGPVLDLLDRVVAAADGCTEADDKLFVHLDRQVRPYRDLLRRMVATGDELEVLAVLADPRRLSCRTGQAPHWPAVPVAEVRELCDRIDEVRGELVDGVRREVLPPLLERLRRFTLEGAERRRVDGRLEFHDLLVLARNLLRDDGEVRAAVRGGLDHVLVDEFQDTDPLQIELAVALAAARDTGGPLPPWSEVDIEPGRLFFVGDPKQSIYRFRRADIVLYQRVQARFVDGVGPTDPQAASSGLVVRLRRNFRSVGPVLAWVNHVFGGLMGEGVPEGQPAYVPLDPSRDGEGSVTLVGGPTAVPDVETVREAEASDVASVVARAKGERGVRFGDIAVLLPTRTALPALERALVGQGVPYRVESRSLVWSTAEARDLVMLLRAVDDPTDEPAVLAALRSPALACGDDDLVAFRLAGGRWDHRHPGAEGLPSDHPVVAGMAVLRRFWERRWWTPVSTLVEEVVRDLWLLELAFANRRQRESWHRTRFLVDQARAYVESGGATLRGFLDWADQQAEEQSAVVESVVPEADDDAVRVMTVHAAKGLEFPVVVLAGLHVGSGPNGGAQVLWGADGRPQVRVGPAAARFRTPGFDEAAASEEALQALEDIRLLYVAATRARDHLVVALHHKEGSRCAAADLWREAERAPQLGTRLESPVPAGPVHDEPTTASASPSPPAPPADFVERWEERRAEAVARHAAFPALAATEAARVVAGVAADEEPEKEEPEAEAPPWQRGRAGTAFGRAVHAVLQTVDLDSGDGVAAASVAQAAAEGIPDRADDVARAVRSALRSPAAREAVAGRAWREVYVAADVDGTVVEGFVDLLYEAPDGLVVVDWKTDRVGNPADVDAAVARYRVQAAAYALALERTLGRPVARCELVFTTAGERPDQRRVAQLDEAKALVAAVASAGPSWDAGRTPSPRVS